MTASADSADTLLATEFAPSFTSAIADYISVLLLCSLNNVSATVAIASFTILPSVNVLLCFVKMCATLNKASVAALAFFVGLMNRECCLWSVVFSSFIFSICRLLPKVTWKVAVDLGEMALHVTYVPSWHTCTADQTHTCCLHSWNKTLFPTLYENSLFLTSYWYGYGQGCCPSHITTYSSSLTAAQMFDNWGMVGHLWIWLDIHESWFAEWLIKFILIQIYVGWATWKGVASYQ